MIDLLSWIVNIGALIAWILNIKYRKYAMILFIFITILSIFYFFVTQQTPFLLRSVLYLFIDISTLYHIYKYENKEK